MKTWKRLNLIMMVKIIYNRIINKGKKFINRLKMKKDKKRQKKLEDKNKIRIKMKNLFNKKTRLKIII